MATIAELLLDIFGGNPYHALAKPARDGGAWYDLVKGALTVEMLEEHLSGEVTLGSYPVLEDNTVKWLGWDIDSNDRETARSMAQRIISQIEHLPYVVEFSGGKGYHIFLFLTHPITAKQAKELTEHIRDIEGLPKAGKEGHVECYPKQAVLQAGADKRKGVGNLIKIPLSKHPTRHSWSVFVNPDNNWEDGPIRSPEEVLTFRVHPDQLKQLMLGDMDKMEQIAQAVAKDWSDGKRHEVSLYLAGYLASRSWPLDQTLELINRVCAITGDTELVNRRESVKDTYQKIHDGKPVAGFMRLAEIMSSASMRVVTMLSDDLAAPDIALKCEHIRLSKGPVWKKEKETANLIYSHLTDPERGQMLHVGETHQLYWFCEETKLVTDTESKDWDILLHDQYRLNSNENYARNINNIVQLQGMTHGKMVKIHRGSLYRGGTLYVNTGGKEIYVLDGKEIKQVYNGYDGLFFETRADAPIPDWEAEPVDFWEMLIDDINFAKSENTPIPATEQREIMKAWVLATFFRAMLPTRPILTLLGAPASGKTTAVRRILKVLEGLDEDVLSLIEDKPDFWRSVIAHHQLVVLDNLEETKAKWIINSLDQIATGSHIEIRELYKTNAVYRIRPDVFVALTAVSMPFTKETLFERMLPLNMEKLDTFIPSGTLDEMLAEKQGALWADLLRKLNVVVAELKRVPTANMVVQMRMADFAMFCSRIKESTAVNGAELERGLVLLRSGQAAAIANSEYSAYGIIEDWLERPGLDNPAEKRSAADLYETLSTLAKKRQRDFYWKNSRALAQHLRAISEHLVRDFGLVVEKEWQPSKGQHVLKYAFPRHVNIVQDFTDNGKDKGGKGVAQ